MAKKIVSPWKVLSRAVAKANAGDHQGALVDLDALVATSTTDKDLESDALYHRGRAKGALGDTAGALRDFDRSLVLAPADCTVLNERAMIHLQRGDHARAKADVLAALADDILGTVSEENALIRCTLAEVLAAAGDNEGALVALERAIHMDATWRREAPKLDSLAALRKDPRWKQIIAGKHVFWLANRPLLRLHFHGAKLDAKRPGPEKVGSRAVPGPIRQLLSFVWSERRGGFQLGLADAPRRSELAYLEDPKGPWVIWGRGSAHELVLVALDDREPSNPEVHVIRPTVKRVFRSKKRLEPWLAALRG